MDAPSTDRTRSRLPAIALAVIGVLLTAVGAYGTFRGPDRVENTAASRYQPGQQTAAKPEADQRTEPAGSASPGTTAPASPPRTTDPVAYAHGVATALFAWDTTQVAGSDRLRVLLREAAPSATDTNGLTSDLASYLPSPQAWRHLADYQTRQSLTIDQAYVPESWDATKAAAGAAVPAGAAAVTIEGVRHRAGVWNGETVTTEHDVTFTIFLACPPTFDRCHLLRLSTLNEPLP